MALQIMTNINVDFYDKKYILINAKQYDDCSRWISITCYNQGDIFNLSSNKHSAYIRYRKADGHGVLNSCRINYKGEVLVELTEQMLAASGICYVDLIIVNKGSAIVNIDTGKIITIDDSAIMSTMAFCINVYEAPFDNSVIESSYEFNALNELLQKVDADYKEIVQLARSYAIGDADDIREGEDTDNAKYYYEQSLINANNAKASETNASISERNALTSKQNAKTSEINAKTSETNAKTSEGKALTSEVNAKASEGKAAVSETNAKTSEVNAAASEKNAKTSEVNAAASEKNVKSSETIAVDNANLAKSYAVGGTGTRENEDMNNAQYYYELTRNVAEGISNSFVPMGTISFSKLASTEKAAGFTYNISDDFVTDDTFKEGAGNSYSAGTNVYYTADGYWDCLSGTTVTGIKGANEVNYRKGNVNITAENIGAISSTDIATIDEVKSYLGI